MLYLAPDFKPIKLRIMKKLFLIAVISAISFTGIAQTTFGVQVGGNLASAKTEYKDFYLGTIKQDNKPKIGFLAGVLAEVPFGNSINFRPELNYIQKGYKYDGTTGPVNRTEDVTLNYVELLLNFVYNVPAGTGNVFFGAGPAFGVGISGKAKTTETGEPNETFDIKFDGKKEAAVTDNKVHLKAFDFGGNILAGYKMTNGLFFTLGYTLGFFNIAPDDEFTYKNSGGLSLKIGYMFGGSKSSSN